MKYILRQFFTEGKGGELIVFNQPVFSLETSSTIFYQPLSLFPLSSPLCLIWLPPSPLPSPSSLPPLSHSPPSSSFILSFSLLCPSFTSSKTNPQVGNQEEGLYTPCLPRPTATATTEAKASTLVLAPTPFILGFQEQIFTSLGEKITGTTLIPRCLKFHW